MLIWHDLADLREVVRARRFYPTLVSTLRSWWGLADGSSWTALHNLCHKAGRTLFVLNLLQDGGRHVHVELVSQLCNLTPVQFCHLFQLLNHLWALKFVFILTAKDLIDFTSLDGFPAKVCSVRPIFLRRILVNCENFVIINTLKLCHTRILHQIFNISDQCHRIDLYFRDAEELIVPSVNILFGFNDFLFFRVY